MKKGIKWTLLIILVALVVLTGCKKSPQEAEETSFETLSTYLKNNNLDLTDILSDWIIPAATVDSIGTDNYYIMDIRSSDDYNDGHIAGAVNSSLGDILTDAGNSGGKPIVVACYTGQGAGHAVCALRLSGYSDAKVLKWGMSSWHADFDKWSANIDSFAVGHTNWTTDATASMVEFDPPDISSSATNGANILVEQVDKMLSEGFKGINATDVVDSPADYFINNYWAEGDVNTYGHIVGAYRIFEDLDIDGLKYLNPDETIVTYCWTGQTSSVVTAYLTVLGYDAKSLKFGANAMIYSELQSHIWTGPGDYPYE